MRAELAKIVAELVEKSAATKRVMLDELGEAIGARAVSQVEIEQMIDAIEAAGRDVAGPEGQHGEKNLRVILPAARALQAELGRRPTPAEIATRTGIDEASVRNALALGSVVGR